ncbi:hypothetical protein PGTUg99_009439 [Puccinia graminis f. sp. tritici]|uniref:Uncharacterized protein n=1 Tax=Puccinia graminis f. sp. tritici TaxID=56615 RepID=A0A5B0SGV5_PUCGR|nr:hypothetical protein PGTUg99_009439 [Puccinia graminis f. sp. tritici]
MTAPLSTATVHENPLKLSDLVPAGTDNPLATRSEMAQLVARWAHIALQQRNPEVVGSKLTLARGGRFFDGSPRLVSEFVYRLYAIPSTLEIKKKNRRQPWPFPSTC